ncbi:tRNA adenosine(34) deaminase TadA [Texcoconibacillus texcoconensis]|uniref:tRNA-specific adenosine deaminase n=1 Tax=Texcoconibacillus texcoconensis TaxID=1095777 RepID=A0A840QUK5_9BACI|nr:tRNA adenosine(34) deaminase TadA [Texcoconibacillus texcoconensis]MBB5174937.1 tRNA(adenine34) deaminase [Texcoconibacillus texcoconensis]
MESKPLSTSDEWYMRQALMLADEAETQGEVPIGAIIVRHGSIIGSGSNRREMWQRSTAHAEMIAIEEACSHIGSWRLTDSTMYVTLEPCPMCAGAILQSRIERVVFSAPDPKGGCCGTFMNLLADERFNHQAEVTGHVLEEESARRLKGFFKKLREKPKT